MNQIIFTVFAIVLVFGTLTQASDFAITDQTVNEVAIKPVKHLNFKKIAYGFSEPIKYRSNEQIQEIEKLFAYIESIHSADPDTQVRMQRDIIKDIVSNIKNKVKDILKKIMNAIDKI